MKNVKLLLLAILVSGVGLHAQWSSTGTITSQTTTTDDVLIGGSSMTGAGFKCFWDYGKTAFRGGYVGGANWDNDSLGFYSFGFGNNVKATGTQGAVAMGRSTTASGNNGATAMGRSTTASGNNGATALGRNTTASGNYGATALGYLTTASGNNGAIALGRNTTASGNEGATALGNYTTASGMSGATALGLLTTASGDYGATALGYRTTADTTSSICIGEGIPNNQNLVNNIPHSLMMGFNSDIPTFFIGQANGVGTTGHVGIATTTPSEKLHINGGLRIAAADSMYAGTMQWDGSNFQGYNGSAWVNLDAAGGSSVWSLNGNKAFYNTGNVGIGTNNPTAKLHVTGDVAVAGSIIHPSDKNLKENIQTINNGLSLINQLNPTTYNHKADKATEFGLSTKLQYGLIAQEVEKVLPEIVIKRALEGKDGTIYQGLDYEKLIPILVAALQESNAKVESQNDKIDAQQTQINEILSKLNAEQVSK